MTSVASGTPTLTVGNNNATNTFAGVITDGGEVVSLIKVGTGTLTLAGSNTFSGGATISAGTLNLACFRRGGAKQHGRLELFQ